MNVYPFVISIKLSNMSYSITYILVILDESGSMYSQRKEIVEAFNNFLTNQLEVSEDKGDDVGFFCVKFNSNVTVVHDRKNLANIQPMTENDYNPNGYTALFDAIAEGVKLVEKDKKKEDRVVCAIITDGHENASVETKLSDVRKIITEREAEGTWTFIYIGNDPDKWVEDVGMSKGNCQKFNDSNVKENIDVVDSAITSFRASSKNQSQNLLMKDQETQTPAEPYDSV